MTAPGAAKPSVVWLHDTYGNRPTPGLAGLAQQCQLMTPTLPGFADTPAGIDGPEDVVFWLADLLAGLDSPDRPVLAGGGLGGWLAAEFAIRYPERLSGLVLVDAYGLQVAGALAADEFALGPAQLRSLLFARPDAAVAREWLPDAEPADRLELTLRARVAAARLAWQFPYSPKLLGRLPRARVPALVLWGGQDGLVPAAHAWAYAEGLPDARLSMLPDTGHYPYLEAPERFVEEILGLVRG